MKNTLIFASFILALSFLCSCNSVEKKKTDNIDLGDKVTVVDSIAGYEDILKYDSLNIGARNALAIKFYKAKDYENALFHFLKVYNQDKLNLTALINIGNVYYDMESYEKAIEYYEKALILDKTNVNVRCDLATCYLNIKQPKTAVKLLKENIKMKYDHAQSHHNLSVVYDELGMVKESEEELQIFNKLSAK